MLCLRDGPLVPSAWVVAVGNLFPWVWLVTRVAWGYTWLLAVTLQWAIMAQYPREDLPGLMGEEVGAIRRSTAVTYPGDLRVVWL